MLRTASFAVLLAAVPLSAHAQLVPGAPTTDWERARSEYSVAVLREYNDLMNEWRENFGTGSAGESADYYSEQARLIIGGTPPLHGRDSIRVYFDSINATLLEIRTGLVDFVANDNLAYATGPVLYRYRDDTGATRSLIGTHVTIITRENRRWRIRTQVLNYGADAPPG